MTGYLPFGLDLTTLLSVGSYAIFFGFMLFGQRIQGYTMLNSVRGSLRRLDAMIDRARRETIGNFAAKTGRTESDTVDRIDQFLNYITIMPVDIDPSGIVSKIEHLANTSDERSRMEVRDFMKDADAVSLSIAQNSSRSRVDPT